MDFEGAKNSHVLIVGIVVVEEAEGSWLEIGVFIKVTICSVSQEESLHQISASYINS